MCALPWTTSLLFLFDALFARFARFSTSRSEAIIWSHISPDLAGNPHTGIVICEN
jgi:hypothetical protein